MNVLSMGGGVQTTAMLIRYRKSIDKVIFADTGAEFPETYGYIEKYLKPFCADHGIEWITVSEDRRFGSLEEHCIERKVIPFRQSRWCTEDYKIAPINRKLRELGATRTNPLNMMIGFSSDESHRLGAQNDRPLYKRLVYPLMDDMITRGQCKEIITGHGWPLPAKSGCDFCPFMKRSKFRALAVDNPERFREIVALEENGMKYPKRTLTGRPLRLLLGNQSLESWMKDDFEGMCDSGHCFT